MSKRLPKPAELRNLLEYSPDTGKLFWKRRPVEMFKGGSTGGAESACARWNSRWAGKEAFTANHGNGPHGTGYRSGRIFYGRHLAHRVIWAMETGAWPKHDIDHEDHDRANNRFNNLREATRSENCKNQTMRSTNTSGFMGVYWDKHNRNWAASICSNGKRHHLGTFTDKKDAIDARVGAEIKYGYHANHGKL